MENFDKYEWAESQFNEWCREVADDNEGYNEL